MGDVSWFSLTWAKEEEHGLLGRLTMTSNEPIFRVFNTEMVMKLEDYFCLSAYPQEEVSSRARSFDTLIIEAKKQYSGSLHEAQSLCVSYEKKCNIRDLRISDIPAQERYHVAGKSEQDFWIDIPEILIPCSDPKLPASEVELIEEIKSSVVLGVMFRKNYENALEVIGKFIKNSHECVDPARFDNLLCAGDDLLNLILEELSESIKDRSEHSVLLPMVDFRDIMKPRLRNDAERFLYHTYHELRSAKRLLTAGLEDTRSTSIFDMDATTESLHKLSIGLERILKIAIIAHQYRQHNNLSSGNFSGRSESHNIFKLTSDLSRIEHIPDEALDNDRGGPGVLLSILTRFAQGDRYFHLDSLTTSSYIESPLSDWYQACYYIYRDRASHVDILETSELAKKLGPVCGRDIGIPWTIKEEDQMNLSYLEAVLKDGWKHYEDVIIEISKVAFRRIRRSAQSLHRCQPEGYRDEFSFLGDLIEDLCSSDELLGLAP